jgi:hypothetical protein
VSSWLLGGVVGGAAALAVSPYLARVSRSVADREDRTWWRGAAPGRRRLVMSALVAGLLGTVAGYAAGWTAALPAFLAFAMLSTPLVLVDVQHHRLPDRLVAPAAICAPKRITRAGWARDVLIVFPRPALFRLRTLPVACAQGDIHTLARGEVTRLGRRPVALDLVLDDGPRLEVAASAKARDRLCGPYLVPRAMPNRPNPPSGQQGVQR